MAYYVILDAGHAKSTGGKRNTLANPDFFEWDFNNKIQHQLKKRLEDHGVTVYLTNPNPGEVKDIGLTQRANLANKKYKAWGKPTNCLFVSLHGNAAGSCAAWSNARGVEVYAAKNASAKSKSAALTINNSIYKEIHALDPGFKNRGRKYANFTVIYKCAMPSILIEHGFYDNKSDLELMVNKIDAFIEADCKGICSHFGIAYKKPSTPQTQQSTPVYINPSSTFNPYIVKIIVDELNIRKDASFSSEVVGIVKKNQLYTIVEQKNGLGKLKSGVGWISLNSKYIRKI